MAAHITNVMTPRRTMGPVRASCGTGPMASRMLFAVLRGSSGSRDADISATTPRMTAPLKAKVK